jgi:hypothetical protein
LQEDENKALWGRSKGEIIVRFMVREEYTEIKFMGTVERQPQEMQVNLCMSVVELV